MAIFTKQGMKIEKIQTTNWPNAIYSMRLPMNSELQSDSIGDYDSNFKLGDKDKNLLIRLCIGGTAHRKVLRMIGLSFICKMPFTWWKHMDQNRVGQTTISRSTMHRGIGKELLSPDDFYVKHWNEEQQYILNKINELQLKIKEVENNKDNKLKNELWRRLIDILPLSLLQERMITINYEVALSILHLRYNVEKLDDEWTFFCKSLLASCPHLKDIYEATKKNRQLTTEEFEKLKKN
jgi:hypothetical protein